MVRQPLVVLVRRHRVLARVPLVRLLPLRATKVKKVATRVLNLDKRAAVRNVVRRLFARLLVVVRAQSVGRLQFAKRKPHLAVYLKRVVSAKVFARLARSVARTVVLFMVLFRHVAGAKRVNGFPFAKP